MNIRFLCVAVWFAATAVMAGCSNSTDDMGTMPVDDSFGDAGGYSMVDFGGMDFATDMAVTSEGKFIVTGYTDAYGDQDMAVARFHSDGTLDTAFGDQGKVILDFFADDDKALAVTLDSLDRIVLAGSVIDDTGAPIAALVRLNPGGGLDTSFGAIETGGGAFGLHGLELTFFDRGGFHDVVIDDNGHFIAAGAGIDDIGEVRNMLVAKFNEKFLQDTFAVDGTFEPVDAPANTLDQSLANALTIDAVTGQLIVAGGVNVDFTEPLLGGANTSLLRLDTDGTLDSLFNFGNPVETDYSGQTNDIAQAVAFNETGEIIVAGRALVGNDTDHALVVMRYNDTGELDNTFAVDGRNTFDLSALHDTAESILMLDDGSFYVGGTETLLLNDDRSDLVMSNASSMVVIKFDSQGETVDTFGNNGILSVPPVASSDRLAAMVPATDGPGVVIAGTGFSPGTAEDFILTIIDP